MRASGEGRRLRSAPRLHSSRNLKANGEFAVPPKEHKERPNDPTVSSCSCSIDLEREFDARSRQRSRQPSRWLGPVYWR